MEQGGHTDITTIIASLDALNLLSNKVNQTISYDHIFSLSQFIESIVLQEKIFIEENDKKFHSPYLELIEKSGIFHHLPTKLIAYQTNNKNLDELILNSIEEACDHVNQLDHRSLFLAVRSRKNCYRSIISSKGKHDENHPFTNHFLELVEKNGDGIINLKLDSAISNLNNSGIGVIGLHVILRLLILQNWMADKKGIVYLPHFSRIPLSSSILTKPKTQRFEEWSLNELRVKKQKYDEEFMSESSSDLTINISPIFLSCLIGAGSPLDVLENAVRMRERRPAENFRKVLRKIELRTINSNPLESELKIELKKRLISFEEDLVEQGMEGFSISFEGFFSKVSFSYSRSNSKKKKSKGLIFLFDLLKQITPVIAAEDLIEDIFGKIDEDNFSILGNIKY